MTRATDTATLARPDRRVVTGREAIAGLVALGAGLEGLALVIKAQLTARTLAMQPARVPEPDKVTKRRLRRLDEAVDARRAALQAKDRAGVAAANSTIRALEREIRERRCDQLEQDWRDKAALESVVQANARGDEIEEVETLVTDWARDEQGVKKLWKGEPKLVDEPARALRIVERTGLRSAFERGFLDGGRVRAEKLYEVGKRYRDAYELVSTYGAGTSNPEGGHTARSSATAGPADERIEAAKDLATFRLGLTARQKRVLDLVCGQDMAIKAAAKAIAAGIPATKKLLINGLTEAWANWRAE